MINLLKIYEFDWDAGNINKNWIRHRVTREECEEIFFNLPNLIYPNEKHSDQEERFYIMGRTIGSRLLIISFTVRNNKFRVISARDINKKERSIYEEQTESDSEI